MRSDWREDAACREANPELFTARDDDDTGGRPNPEAVSRALAYCSECPVIEECCEFADSRTDALTVGVWGGMYRSRRLASQRQRLTGKGPLTAVFPQLRTC